MPDDDIHRRVTPAYGTEIPEVPPEPDTSPDLLRGLRCPECLGHGYVLTVVETDETGALEKAVSSPCPMCRAAGTVDRKTFAAHHAQRQGRNTT